MGMHHNFFKPWRIGRCINTRSITIDPGNDGPERIVIVGVHRGIAGVAVPAFPPGGRTLGKHVPPGRIRIVQQQTIR